MPSFRSLWDRLPFIGRLMVTTSVALLVAGSAMLLVSARQEAAEVRADLQTELAKELETLPATLRAAKQASDVANLARLMGGDVGVDSLAEDGQRHGRFPHQTDCP